jgi:hypothetical protein
MNFPHTPFYEIVEIIKDTISHEVDGRVYDRHVADVLALSVNSVRMYKSIDYLPLEQLAVFCANRNLSLDTLIFGRK